MTVTLIDLVIAALAVWRVSHMLVYESGPWSIFETLRYRVGATWDVCSEQRSSTVTNVFCCTRCISVWVSAVVVALMFHSVGFILVMVFAVSGLSVFVQRITERS
jgi:hypothetical protein